MADNEQQTPGAGAESESPQQEPVKMTGAEKKSLRQLSKNELVKMVEQAELSRQVMARKLSAMQAVMNKQQSVDLTFGRRKVKGTEQMDITGVSVKCYGLTGPQAANESIVTMVSTLVSLKELGHMTDVVMIDELPVKLKTISDGVKLDLADQEQGDA